MAFQETGSATRGKLVQITIDWSRGDRRWRTVNTFRNRLAARLYRHFIVLAGHLPFLARPVRIQVVRW